MHLAFADRDILDDVSFILTEKSRSALAGGNGSGKSTLLKVLSGQMAADSMHLSKTRDLRISYLPQSDILFEEGSVYSEVERGYERFDGMLAEKKHLEQETCPLHRGGQHLSPSGTPLCHPRRIVGRGVLFTQGKD